MMDKKEPKKILVEALPAFMSRRGKTLNLKRADFRKLKAGEAVLIDAKDFDKNLFREVKSGNK